MTENEAIKDIRECVKPSVGGKSLEIAIQALKEVQHYRAIGTVGEFKALKEKALKKLDELIEYQLIGTIEEFKALKESKCQYWNAEHEDCALNYAEIRNKAIDEFVERTKQAYAGMNNIPQVEKATANTIVMGIAEQIKATN